MNAQESFREQLTLGRLDQARRLLNQGASLCLGPGYMEEAERKRMFSAAAAAPTLESLTWLRAQHPDLTLSGVDAVTFISTLLNGRNSCRNIAAADWAVANLDVIPHVTDDTRQDWFRQALHREDPDALAWLMHPPAPLPPLEDTPEAPLLNRAMGEGMRQAPDRRLPLLQYLLKQGVPARVDRSEGPLRGHSPLSLLLRLYEDDLKKARPEATGIVEVVQALWVPFIDAGADPRHIAPDSFSSLRQRLLDTPLAHLVQAHERFLATPADPQRERRRLRS